eukprot:14555602-Ditylum_brightwellii.AAC.1
MPGYIDKARLKYGHQKPKQVQHAPHKHSPMHYGAKTQLVEKDLTELLEKMGIKQVQEIVGTLLYYACAVDPTLAAVLSTIASQQANATKKWKKHVTNY